MDDTISIEVQRFQDGRLCLGLSRSLAGVHFKALRKHGPWDEPHLTPQNDDGIDTTKRGAGVPVRHGDVDDIIVRLVLRFSGSRTEGYALAYHGRWWGSISRR